MQYSLTEAKAQLSKLLDQVEQGEEVIIVRNGKPIARFQYLGGRSSCVLGQHQGEIEPPDDGVFDAMSDEDADSFMEGSVIEGYAGRSVLIDTHVLFWASLTPQKLSLEVQRILKGGEYEILVSVVSIYGGHHQDPKRSLDLQRCN